MTPAAALAALRARGCTCGAEADPEWCGGPGRPAVHYADCGVDVEARALVARLDAFAAAYEAWLLDDAQGYDSLIEVVTGLLADLQLYPEEAVEKALSEDSPL